MKCEKLVSYVVVADTVRREGGLQVAVTGGGC
jgi:hypothetical protein